MATIKQLDHGRNNNFDLLRFIAAAMVIFSHSYLVTGNFKYEPLAKLTGFIDFGALGVKVFFTISGYLITKSLYSQPTLGSFVWARSLRIFPGLIAAALFCVLLIGPVCTTYSLGEYFSDDKLYSFLWRLITVHNFANSLPGTFHDNPYPNSANSPIWTLAAELLLYLGVLILGILVLLWRRQFNKLHDAIPVIIMVILFFAGMVYAEWYRPYLLGWSVMFFLGVCTYFLRDVIVISLPFWLAMLVVCGLIFHYRMPCFTHCFDVMVAYGIFVFSYHPRVQIRHFKKLGDFSYGLYIYAFPLQQLLIAKFTNRYPPVHFLVSFLLALIVAIPSWYFIEKPALKLKAVTCLKK